MYSRFAKSLKTLDKGIILEFEMMINIHKVLNS